ncbi:proton-conducting transporter transmembrane domain-containing protein [Desulforhabdus amnigena]|uniref:Hydrogenase n=1 Tax=Desulforhabdus amnigena TaxID=40218 RepID=A0A9W6D2H4_9BACT|nr:proton-conducting transporter membrane subunit [Desulforhabdus amnigena]GLI34650.1 hydrogenase [Desulforhabdus amnigena]
MEISQFAMLLLLIALTTLCCSGFSSLLAGKNRQWTNALGPAGAVAGCILGLAPAVHTLLSGTVERLYFPWNIPYASFFLEIDALSAFFLIPIFVLGALAAVYGRRYMTSYGNHKSLGAFWFFYNLLIAGMVLVVVARNGILFLMVWEIMSLSSFFLVTFENEKESVRRAGWTYLTATHLGTAFLFILFLMLGHQAGTEILDFDRFTGTDISSIANIAFVLALVGFGTKAGLVPFHVWLPEAHPAAPSHVSAVMSGAMIKTGIYGLLRIMTLLGPPAPWWGWLLLGIGLISGILGVLFALAQHDMKRLLAYHSVENIGIITLGLGLGVLGISTDLPVLAVLGFGGGLLHVINHAFFKGLLFLGAGSVMHATGTGELDHLGGLIKKMPWTSATFLVGSVAISGLPPLNGFVSEFLIYMGAFGSVQAPSMALTGFVVIVGLALIGGLALACFAKAFGIVFLGEPRSAHTAHAHESSWGMSLPMGALAALCALIAFCAPLIMKILYPAVTVVTGYRSLNVQSHISVAMLPLKWIAAGSVLLILAVSLVAWLKQSLLANRTVEEADTWDCGYIHPTARMQYTASSFAAPLIKMFQGILRPGRVFDKPDGLFPHYATLKTEPTDIFRNAIYRPLFLGVERLALKLRWLQEGHVQLYILYIALTLLALLIWNLR